jgi:hypothetical protein
LSSIEQVEGLKLFFAAGDGPPLASEQDALELLGETYGLDIDMIVVPVERFSAAFFDLSTTQAGQFFQKMQNYRIRLVVMGDISNHVRRSKALRDFMGETNRVGHHMFVADRAELLASVRNEA